MQYAVENENYEFITLPILRHSGSAADHDKFKADRHTGFITGTIHALTPLHIGAGQTVLSQSIIPTPTNAKEYRLAGPFFRHILPDGSASQRIIPGSSWRGVMRSFVEILTASNLPHRNNSKAQLDPASLLFGAQGRATNLHFHDLTTADHQPWELFRLNPRWKPKEDDDQKRKVYLHFDDYEHYNRDGKEIIEVCPAKTLWTFRIDYENLSNQQLGLLLIAMGTDTDQPIYPKIGGGKGQRIGSISIDNVQVWSQPQAEQFRSFAIPAPVLMDNAALVANGHQGVHVDTFRRLRELIGSLPEGLKRNA